MQTSALFGAKMSKFMVCPHGQGFSQCGRGGLITPNFFVCFLNVKVEFY